MAEHFVFNSHHLLNGQQPESVVNLNHQKQNIQQAQESIYSFLKDILKQCPPETVLQEFNRLFIQHLDSVSSDSTLAIYKIGLANDEEEFRNTIKRCCYLLINNWKNNRAYKKHIKELIEMFSNPIIKRQSVSPTINRLRSWLQNFVKSKDYQELKLFASTKHQEQRHWSNRYTCYLLGDQSAD